MRKFQRGNGTGLSLQTRVEIKCKNSDESPDWIFSQNLGIPFKADPEEYLYMDLQDLRKKFKVVNVTTHHV